MTNGINGLDDLGHAMDAYAPIDALAEDYDFYGLDAFISPEMIKSSLTSAAAGAGGILVIKNVMDRVAYFDDKPRGRLLTEALVGVLGGRLLWDMNRDAASGLVGGIAGGSLAELINGYIAEMQANGNGNGNGNGTTTEGMGYTEVKQVPAYMKRGRVSVPAQWGHGRAPAGRQMSGLGRDIVTRADYLQVDGLEDSDNLGGWISCIYG